MEPGYTHPATHLAGFLLACLGVIIPVLAIVLI